MIGSGRQAFSYLIEHDGFLFESPITWYAKDRRWGLSPGYERRVSRFERPILSECLVLPCQQGRASHQCASTVTARRSFRDMRSAASGATGRESCTFVAPSRRRPGRHDREPRGSCLHHAAMLSASNVT